MNNDITILNNQVMIMKGLLEVVSNQTKKELKEHIDFTNARIRGLS